MLAFYGCLSCAGCGGGSSGGDGGVDDGDQTFPTRKKLPHLLRFPPVCARFLYFLNGGVF